MEDQFDTLSSLGEKIRCLPPVVTRDEVVEIILPLLGIIQKSINLAEDYKSILQESNKIISDRNDKMKEIIDINNELIDSQYGVSARFIIEGPSFK
jgi:hypothetical protein